MRSSGQSETRPTSQPFTHHEDLLPFLEALNISRVSLVGHSNYAVALDFTIAYPELLGALQPGYLADLVAFERDPMTCAVAVLPEMRPKFTIVGGKVASDLDGLLERSRTV